MISEFLIVSEEQSSIRLDQWLHLHFSGYSRAYFQFLIEEGSVLVNGSIVKKMTKLFPGDEIEVGFLLTPKISLEPEPIPLNIIFEDEHLLVVDKPAGMVVHPSPGHFKGTFVNALLHHCQNLEVGLDDLRPGIVHRLDKDTSGLLIAAKHSQSHRNLIAQFHSRLIKKTYHAVCLGHPNSMTISEPIGRHPKNRKEMAINYLHGKEAITVCQPLHHLTNGLSLVELQPLTGRTHQLRVHMKHSGFPILGDSVYGVPSSNKKFGFDSQLLHASRLQFLHPITQQKLDLCSPPPFKEFIVDLYF